MSLTSPPKALLTDVFGTVVDWRKTVTEFLTTNCQDTLNSTSASIPSTVRENARTVDWGDFAWQWRKSYYHFTRSYDPSLGNFKSVDQHHAEALVKLLSEHNLTGLWDDQEIRKTSMIWHFLDPWPDSAIGLGLLNQKFETCTLSNGNTALLDDLAKHGSLPYKHIISAEEFKAYKPHPNVYNGAAKRLGLQTNECALIAAHLNDLQAARSCGYQTIYIERLQEEGFEAEKIAEIRKEGWVDMWVTIDEGGFEEVARRFGLGGKGTNRQAVEQNARQGIYHESGSIVGDSSTSSRDGAPNASVGGAASQGTYHEDPSIMKSQV